MGSLIVTIYATWSFAWLLVLVLEWLRHRRAERLVLYFIAWFGGGLVLAAARVLFT